MMPPLDWPHRSASRSLSRGGIHWHVQVMGSGPTLLLLHGTGASTHSFRALMPLLAERFTVVAPDLPGHAFSEAPPAFEPSLVTMAAALSELLDALALPPPAVVVGHSAGAAVALQMVRDQTLAPRLVVGLAAALIPFRGLSRALFLPTARLLSQSNLASRVIAFRARDSQNVDRVLRGTGSSLDAAGVELYRRLTERPAHIAGALAMMANWDLEPLYASLPSIAVPLLLLAGDRDKAVPLDQALEVARRTRHGKAFIVEGAGHLLHEEKPAEVSDLIRGATASLGPLVGEDAPGGTGDARPD